MHGVTTPRRRWTGAEEPTGHVQCGRAVPETRGLRAGVLVTDRLVVLRLRKCATAQMVTTVRAVVGGEFRKTLELGRTVPNSHGRIDFPLDGRRVVGTVRDPWSWYVSLWAYGCAGRGGLHARVTQHSSRRQVLSAMWRDPDPPTACPGPRWPGTGRRPAVGRLGGPLRRLRRRRGLPGVARPHPRSGLRAVRRALVRRHGDAGVDGAADLPLSRAVRARHGAARPAPGFGSADEIARYDAEQNVCDEIIRTDRIAAEIRGVFDRAGYELDARQEAVLAEHTHDAPRRNRSEHRPWIDYHDAADAAARRRAGPPRRRAVRLRDARRRRLTRSCAAGRRHQPAEPAPPLNGPTMSAVIHPP